jgi:hypothetical protein
MARLSMHMRQLPSFFGTSKAGTAQRAHTFLNQPISDQIFHLFL